MNTKKIVAILGLATTLVITPPAAFAQTITPAPVNQQNLSFMKNLYTQLKGFETQNPQFVRREAIVITTINGSIVTGTQTNKKTNITKTYAINAGSAIVVRRFWGQSTLSQISVGDKIRVIGTWTDDSKTAINAFLIRDMSIQERADTFSGTVTTIGTNSITFQSNKRGSWTINVESGTKITGKKGVPMQFSNIATNDRLRVDGMLDSASKVITTTTIRDMSYPTTSGNNVTQPTTTH